MNRKYGTYALLLVALAACDDTQGPDTLTGREFGVVVNSQDRTLSLFSVDSAQNATSVGLGPDGSPVTVAARRQFAIVPMGVFPAAVVVNLSQRSVAHSIALPANSGATGAAFLNDSIALVASPNLNNVTPINVLRGTSGTAISVGGYPQFIIASGDTAFVLNAELGPNFNPVRNGRVSVITGSPARVVATIDLSGTNPGSATIGRDGLLYVLNSGSFGQADGSVSVIDRRTLRELRHETGFGDFPGAIAAGGDGRLYIAAFAYGVVVWDPAARSFVRGLQAAVQPGGIGSASGVGADGSGRIYSLKPDCRNPSSAFRLTNAFAVEREINVGICPITITFTRLSN